MTDPIIQEVIRDERDEHYEPMTYCPWCSTAVFDSELTKGGCKYCEDENE